MYAITHISRPRRLLVFEPAVQWRVAQGVESRSHTRAYSACKSFALYPQPMRRPVKRVFEVVGPLPRQRGITQTYDAVPSHSPLGAL
jgi:hypothetical protein